ncbi:MAG: hypothetical protein PHZ09_10520 [Eubacteriales bacterium]|nr:hypothetical protein [Eubacteriales bacterium]
MKKIFFCVVLLSLFINLVSCNNNIPDIKKSSGQNDTAVSSSVTGVYELKTLSLPDYYSLSSYTSDVYGINNVITNNDRVYVVGSKETPYINEHKDSEGNIIYNKSFEPKSIIYSVDLNGENEQILTLDEINPVSITSLDIDSAGNFYIFGYSALYKLNPDGELISSVNINNLTDSGEFYYSIKFDADENLYLISQTYITVLNPDLKFLFEIKINMMTLNLQLTPDNKMLAENIYTGFNNPPNYYYIDSDEKKLDSIAEDMVKTPPVNVTDNIKRYSVKFGDGYDIYYNNRFGVYGFKEGDETAVMLCDWVNSGLYVDYTELISVISSDKMVCVSQDMFAEKDNSMVKIYDIIIMTRVPDGQVVPKITITLAYADTVDSILLAAINFNRLNDKYRVVFKDYSVYKSIEDMNAGVDKFNMDLVAGNIPDIILFTMIMPYNDYIDKGMLVDLYELFDSDDDINRDDIIKAVRIAYETNGELYCLPTGFSISTLTGKASIVGDKESMTLEEFYELYEEAGENASVINSINKKYFFKTLLKANLGDFVDYKNLTCSFSSKRFIEYIEFIKNLPIKEFEDKTVLTGPINIYYSDLVDIRDDKLYLLDSNISSVNSLVTLKYIYGGEEYVIKGYPTDVTNGTLIDSMYRFGISSKSECKNGSFEFIKYFLTDKMQTSDEVLQSNLPVTVSALNIILDKAINTYYYLNESYFAAAESGLLMISEENEKPDSETEKFYKSIGSILYRFTEDDANHLRTFLSDGNIRNKYEAKINEIIWEELDIYFDGGLTAAQVADYIQSRVSIYINERYK